MLKITKISTIVVIFYIFIYAEIFDKSPIILYGASIIAVLSMAAYWLNKRQIDITYVPFGIWNNYIIIIYSVIVGIFVSYKYSELISSCITYASFSIICVAICYISAEEKSFEWVFNVLIIVALICAIYMITNGVEFYGYGRTLSHKNNPHTFAAVMTLGVFSTAYKCKRLDVKEFALSSVIIILFLYCIVECGSRKYFIACTFLVAVWMGAFSLFVFKNKEAYQKLILLSVLSIVVVVGYMYYKNTYSQTYTHSRMLDMDNSGNLKRVDLYRYAFKIFLDHPVFGGGYDQFKFWSNTGGYAHSTYAEALADFGFVGCVLYFYPIITTSYNTIRQALVQRKSYNNSLLLTLCLLELFIGVGQVFFMEFYLFIAWTIIFTKGGQIYSNENTLKENELKGQPSKYKYIRDNN